MTEIISKPKNQYPKPGRYHLSHDLPWISDCPEHFQFAPNNAIPTDKANQG